jgi:hypothetical protein
MKVSELLIELKITLEELRKYEESVIFSFDILNQEIPEVIYLKVIDIHKNIPHKNVEFNDFKKNLLLFPVKDTYKFNAKVKWYYNQQTNGEYGFLEKQDLPDIRFSGKHFKNKDPKNLKPGDNVIVTISQKEIDNKKNNLKAISVNYISDETDLNYLLFYFFNYLQTLGWKEREDLLQQIGNLSEQLNEEIIKSIETFFIEKIDLNNLDLSQTHHIYNLLKLCSVNIEVFNDKLIAGSPDEFFKTWLQIEELQIEFYLIKETIFACLISDLTNVQKILDRWSLEQKTEIIDSILKSSDKSELKKLKEIHKLILANNLDITIFNNKLNEFNSEEIFKIWIEIKDLDVDYYLIKNRIIEYIKSLTYTPTSIFDRLKKDSREDLLIQLLEINSEFDYRFLKDIIEVHQEFNISVNYNYITSENQIKLWLDNLIVQYPFDLVFNTIKRLKKDHYDKKDMSSDISNFVNNIFLKTNAEELSNLLFKAYYTENIINDDDSFRTIIFFLEKFAINHPNRPFNYLNSDLILREIPSKITDEIYTNATNYYRLQLFVLDYTDNIEYENVIIYTGLLSSYSQKLFFKKVIKLIAKNQLQLSLEDLNRITTIDYQTSEYAKEIDGVGLDFTLSVILKLITDLKNKITTSRTSIFDLVSNQIKSPKDLLVIDGFFEKCNGKTIIEEDGKKKLADGTFITLYKKTKKENFLPRFSTFCDGSKAVIKGTNESILCNKSGFEFWWCENSQCYDACRNTHDPSQWKKYTLEDILKILEIPYEPTQYEILLNVINRVNRFLEHLSCRKCKSILKPKGKSNYTFYGVTMFSCTNQDCQEHAKDIYLSHCLNGQCEDIIDSRDSVRCKTNGFKDECGWYICKNCNACCSSEKLTARKNNLEKLRQEYKCHVEGHRDRGIICCSDCGHEMKEPVASIELYKKQLDWFIEQKDINPNIIRSGRRKNDNKWWFIWSRGTYSYEEYRKQIQGLFNCGYSIPDFNNKEKDNQLIAEPFEENKLLANKIFVCPNCDHHFDLNNKENFNFVRKKAVQKFHNNIFPAIDK